MPGTAGFDHSNSALASVGLHVVRPASNVWLTSDSDPREHGLTDLIARTLPAWVRRPLELQSVSPGGQWIAEPEHGDRTAIWLTGGSGERDGAAIDHFAVDGERECSQTVGMAHPTSE